MNFTEEEKDENRKLLKQELLKVDFAEELKKMGADIHITNGKNYSFIYNIVKDNRLIAALDMGPLSYPKTTTKFGKESTIYIDYKKDNLEELLKTNSPFIPLEVRMGLDLFRYTCKHEPIESNPLYSDQDKVVHKMNNLNNKNNELIDEFKQLSDNGKLLEVLGNMPHYKDSMTGADLNQMFKCDRFKAEDNYHKFVLSVRDGESNLIIREIEHKGVKGFVGAIMSYQDGLHTLQTFKPVQSLDREVLREVLSRPNPLHEATKDIGPELVKSNVVPFEKPQEDTSAAYHDDAFEDDNAEVKRRRRLTP